MFYLLSCFLHLRNHPSIMHIIFGCHFYSFLSLLFWLYLSWTFLHSSLFYVSFTVLKNSTFFFFLFLNWYIVLKALFAKPPCFVNLFLRIFYFWFIFFMNHFRIFLTYICIFPLFNDVLLCTDLWPGFLVNVHVFVFVLSLFSSFFHFMGFSWFFKGMFL